MHKEWLCAKKRTEIGSNLGVKATFFPRTQRTLPKRT